MHYTVILLKKQVVGLIEPVKVIGKNVVESKAKFDTGAARSCIDEKLAEKVKLGPIIKFVRVKSATLGKINYVRRPVYKAKIEIAGKRIPVELSIANRKNLKYDVLIGRDIIKSNFIIDVEHKNKTVKKV